MKFGVGIRNRMTGAEASVRVLQVASMLPTLYVFSTSGYHGLFVREGLFSRLFALGFSALPRAEALLMSLLYRGTHSEMVFYFALLILALALGLCTPRLLGERTGVTARWVYAALIGLDLIVRLLPLPFNHTFGLPMAVVSFLVRLGCLVLVVLDLRAHRLEESARRTAGGM